MQFGSALGLITLGLLGSACAIPHGSYARPARAAPEGTMVIGAGAVVPFAAAGAAKAGDESASFSVIREGGFTVVPVGSFDYAVMDGTYIGVDISAITVIGGNGTGIFINPKFDYAFSGLERKLSLVIEGNIGRFSDGSNAIPYLSPTIGLRGSFDLGPIGLILQQSIGTAFITFTAPGAFLIDIGIPVGAASIHIFPEIRWDPTFFFVGVASGALVFLSAGLSVGVAIPSL